MRFLSLAPLLLVPLAACADFKHPREVVGTWTRDTLYGDGILRRVDTLRLAKDGTALRSGSTAPTDRAASSTKPTVWAEGLKWAYQPRAEGHLLCFFVQEGWEPECHTVRIDSDSVIVVDGNAYRRLAGR
jgi:hypothetical protein